MRNLGLIISFWLSAISFTTNALALGLGEIEVSSYLNQPLNAEIEVISARAGEIDDLLVGLASREAFTKAGLARPTNLSELRFAVKKSEEGDTAVIKITTKAAIKEPFLNFLVEADWSKGRVLREFTILLDPPYYADNPAPAAQQAPSAKAPETAAQTQQPVASSSEGAGASETETSAAIPKPIALNEATSTSVEQLEQEASDMTDAPDIAEPTDTGTQAETDSITVIKGDTLWGIASKLQDSGLSINQIMLAIQRTNPDAFTGNNINNMKVGSVLRIPDSSEMGAIDRQQAYAQALEQNGLWDDYVARITGMPAVSAKAAGAGTITEEAQTQGSEPSTKLNLLTPGDGESDVAGAQSEGEDANELRVKLALAEEELDASRIDNLEQESRIADLEARLSKFEELQKMLEIEDDSLAKLQSDQAQASDQGTEKTVIGEIQPGDEDTLLEDVLGEDNAADTMAEDSSTAVTTSDSEKMPEEQSSVPPVPVIVTEVASEPSLLDGLIPDILPSLDSLAFDPVMLGGLGGILLLLIGLIIYRRKKSTDSDDGEILVNDPIFASDIDEDEDLTPIHMADDVFGDMEDDSDDSEISLTDASQFDEDLEDENDIDGELDDLTQANIASQGGMPVTEAPSENGSTDEQDDTLNEADVYLAYNLYDNAEELLTQSLEENPERADYRSKLLDTHFATKNVEAFLREAEALKSMGDQANRYWDRVQVMGYELAPDNALFAGAIDSNLSAADLEVSKPAEADFDLGPSEDDSGFSLTDFELDDEETGNILALDAEVQGAEADEDLESSELFDAENISFDGEDNDISDDLDFSFDESADSVDEPENVAGTVEFDLPDDLDLGSGDIAENLDAAEVDTAVMAPVGLDDELEENADADTGAIETTDIIELDDAVENDLDFIDMGDDAITEAANGIEAGAAVDTSTSTDGFEDDYARMDDIETTDVVDDLSAELESDLDSGLDEAGLKQQLEGGTDNIEFDLGAFDDDDPTVLDLEQSTETLATGTFVPDDFDELTEMTDIGAFENIEDLMLPDDVDEVSTKLDLARAFIDMGDAEGARSSLGEVMSEGSEEQKAEATSLLDQL
ncbi:MAG: LysM peptidoglycan-binding domain-containing protein [Gammaproteobacteria bacterium]|nr:LysM peptidoglycan-binding domain-containing protein [Gammaproteobacteria bacterium]